MATTIPAQQTRQQIGIACEECRRKRVRCDRATPQCSACASSGTNCVVRENCPRRGPKKGYLKTLQNKIDDLQAQLEKNKDASYTIPHLSSPTSGVVAIDDGEWDTMAMNKFPTNPTATPVHSPNLGHWPVSMESAYPMFHVGPWDCSGSLDSPTSGTPDEVCPTLEATAFPLTPTMHNDLDQLFFDRVYVFAPILQARRYRSWSTDPGKSHMKTCLQHAMWTLAASRSSSFQSIESQLYVTTIQLLQTFETGALDQPITLELAQTWILLAIYELTCVDFHRGLITAGKAFRLIQVLRIYELDAAQTQSPEMTGWHVGLVSPVQEDWVDVESKRRTFWLAFILDRFTSMIDGLHLFFDERMLRVRLPAPEANFASGRPKEMSSPGDITGNENWPWPDTDATSFTETAFMAIVCGQALENRQRPPVKLCDANHSNGSAYEFCRRHRFLNTVLARRINVLRAQASIESLGPMLAFTALAAYIAVLMLYDVIESQPLGIQPQEAQITTALRTEHQQLSAEAVADAAILITSLTQHFQVHPFTPILLLAGARISRVRPELNNADDKLTPCILTALQAMFNDNKLAQLSLHLIGTQSNTWHGSI